MPSLSPRLIRFAILIIGLTGLYGTVHSLPWDEIKAAAEGKQEPAPTKPIFIPPTIEGKAAVIYDSSTDTVIYSKEGSAAMPLASITKLVTALTSSKVLSPDSRIVITETDLAEGSNAGLTAGHEWRYQDLLDVMLTTSSNGAAKAIGRSAGAVAGKDFVTMMNETVGDLGLSSMNFRNETGLDLAYGGPGATGSAVDVARLLSKIAKERPELLGSTKLSTITKTTVEGSIFSGHNTNLIVQTIPGFVASKTGFTDLAGGNLAVMLDAGLNHPVAIVVLGSSQDGRFSDMEKLVTSGLQYLAHQ